MHGTTYDTASATQLIALGYDGGEASIVARAAALVGPPLEPFARDLWLASIHVTGHQLMGVWQGCAAAKAYLYLTWPGNAAGRMISGRVSFSGIPERMSSRQAVAVGGVVAEWLMQERDSSSTEDEWDLFDRLRDCAWMSPDDIELTDGKITWHAVKRASKLLRRHWNIVHMSSASKRKDLLFRLLENLPAAQADMRRGRPLAGSTALNRV